jgi:Sulfotransferase family
MAPPSSLCRFTFLHGVRIRSGTNYLGQVMSCNPHVQLVPPKKTTDEFPLLRDLDSWERAFSSFVSNFTGPKDVFQFRKFLPYLGSAWLNYVVDTFELQPGHVFIKDPSVKHIDRFFDLFPEAKLLLLLRDGRDNVASTVKAGLAVRAHTTTVAKAKTRLKHFLRRDFASAARDWAEAVTRIERFDEQFRDTPLASRYMIIRYEDVFRNPRPMAERIFAFMEVPWDDRILEAVENADVVGSSFYSASGQEDARKPNWKATPKTEAFQPTGRWKRWGAAEKALFKRIAGPQLIRMGYEENLSW